MDATEQLKFIVDFANRDLENQRPGDWLNLQDDFRRFFPSEGFVQPVMFDANRTDELEEYPPQKIAALQKELRALFEAKAKGSMVTIPLQFDVDYVRVAGGVLNISSKRVRDVFLTYVLFVLFDEKTASRIRQCAPCGKFFFRVRRQVHCSAQCADKASHLKEQAKAKKKQRRKR